MFNFSTKTQINKSLKLLDVLKKIGADKDIKLEATKINKIVITNIINKDTINSLVDSKYNTIYIINIELNKKEVPMKFIELFDRNMRVYTYFVVRFNDKVYTTMCFKEIDKIVKLNTYYHHDFDNEKIIELPNVNSVDDVYKELYSYEINLKYRENETIDELFKRNNMIKKLRYQIDMTHKAIIYQAQPKKKFEYHKRLQEYQKELERLL